MAARDYLRAHSIPGVIRYFGCPAEEGGGVAPNVVQPRASVRYQLRAQAMRDVNEVYLRLCDVARGAALMTGTRLEIEEDVCYESVIPNVTIESVAQENLEALGVPAVDENDRAFASAIRATLSDEEKRTDKAPETKELELAEKMPAYHLNAGLWYASTDAGDVNRFTPTLQYRSAVWAVGTSAHSWQAVAQGRSAFARKGTEHAAKVLAATAVDLFQNPEILRAAKKELQETLEKDQ